jgi:hypothetical protein
MDVRSGDVRFDLATAADDADIRRLLREHPVPGRVTVSFEREPSYFLGCGTMGPVCQVLVARDVTTGELVGVACRAIRPMFVNGEPTEVGYLAQLRIHRRHRGRWLLSRGFRMIHALHADARVTRYITTITDDNAEARTLLVDHPRRHFPAYREIGQLLTLAVVTRRARDRRRPGCEVTAAGAADLGDVLAFLDRHGPARQFYPAYTKDDFGDAPATRGFRIEDFLLASRGSELLGVAGLWDQRAYKQTVVHGYTGALRWARPLTIPVARLVGLPSLPRPGRPVHSAHLAFICVAGSDPAVFQTLLDRARDLAARRGLAYLIVGLDARDPLLATARQCLHVAYPSRLYTVSFPEDECSNVPLDSRVPYLETAAL